MKVVGNTTLAIMPSQKSGEHLEVLTPNHLRFTNAHLQFIVLEGIALELLRVHAIQEAEVNGLSLLALFFGYQRARFPRQLTRCQEVEILAREESTPHPLLP